MVKILGAREVSRRMKALTGPVLDRNMGLALFAGASALAVEAQISISTGAVSGLHHVPSRPGEPPKNDTHFLADNIEIAAGGAGSTELTATVSSNAPYSRALEFGTSRMGERPFMRPAAAKTRKEIKRLITEAINATERQTRGI